MSTPSELSIAAAVPKLELGASASRAARSSSGLTSHTTVAPVVALRTSAAAHTASLQSQYVHSCKLQTICANPCSKPLGRFRRRRPGRLLRFRVAPSRRTRTICSVLAAVLQCQNNCSFQQLFQTSTQTWLQRCPVATPPVFHLSTSQFTTTYHSTPNLSHPSLLTVPLARLKCSSCRPHSSRVVSQKLTKAFVQIRRACGSGGLCKEGKSFLSSKQ